MASRAHQSLTVRTIKKSGTGPGERPSIDIIAVRRTGYCNIWVNGTHYYYDRKEELKNLNEVDMHNYFPGTEKKGVIVISRK